MWAFRPLYSYRVMYKNRYELCLKKNKVTILELMGICKKSLIKKEFTLEIPVKMILSVHTLHISKSVLSNIFCSWSFEY